MYHILEDIIYKDEKLYSLKIEKVLEINVAHSEVIKMHPLLEEIETQETYECCILHKRGTRSGYYHILMEELFSIHYCRMAFGLDPQFVLNLENKELPFNSRLNEAMPSWGDWLSNFTPCPIRNKFDKPVKIKKAIVGWKTLNGISIDIKKTNKGFIFRSFSDSIVSMYGIKKIKNANDKKILFDIRNERFFRHLLNSKDLKNQLNEFDIEFVDFSSISIREQIEKVFNSFILISQHGAGLSNLIFLQEGCYAIEIGPEDHEYKLYEKIATAFGINYIKHKEPKSNCEYSGNSTVEKIKKIRDQDLTVDIKRLKQKINEILTAKT